MEDRFYRALVAFNLRIRWIAVGAFAAGIINIITH